MSPNVARHPRSEPAPPSLRFAAQLQAGLTIPLAASRAGISVELGQIIADDLLRRGLLVSAASLCTSGLGACGGGVSPEVKLSCAGCPLNRL